MGRTWRVYETGGLPPSVLQQALPEANQAVKVGAEWLPFMGMGIGVKSVGRVWTPPS